MNKMNLEKFEKKMKVENLIKSIICGISASLLINALIIILFKRIPVRIIIWVHILAFIAISTGLTFWFYKFVFRINHKTLAKRLDKDAKLQERVKTMVEFQDDDSLMANLQRQDTNEKLDKVENKTFKMRFSFSNFILAIVAAAALTVSVFVPAKEITPNARPTDSASNSTESSDPMQEDDTILIELINNSINQMKKIVNDNTSVDQETKDSLIKELDDLNNNLVKGDKVKDRPVADIKATRENVKEILDEKIGDTNPDSTLTAQQTAIKELNDSLYMQLNYLMYQLAIELMEREVRLNPGADKEIKDELHNTLEELKDNLVGNNAPNTIPNDAIDAAIYDVDSILGVKVTKDDIGTVLKDIDATAKFGEALVSGNVDEINAFLNETRVSLKVLTVNKMKKAIVDITDAINSALDNTDDPLVNLLREFSDRLSTLNYFDSNLQNVLTDIFDNLQTNIIDIVTNQSYLKELKDSLIEQLEELKDPNPDDPNEDGEDGENGENGENGDGENGSMEDLINDAIDQMEQDVNDSQGTDQETKDELNDTLEDLRDQLLGENGEEKNPDEAIDEAKDKIDKTLDDKITKDEIGEALQHQDTTKKVGEGVSNGDVDQTKDALDEMRDSLKDLTGDDLKNALDDISGDINNALDESGVEPGDPLRDAFKDLADQLESLDPSDPNIQDKLDDIFDNAKDSIGKALDDQNSMEDLKDSLDQQLDDLKDQLQQEGQGNGENGNGEGEESDGNDQNGDGEPGEDGEDEDGKGPGGENAGEGEGGTIYASDDLIYDPRTGKYVTYGELINEYYEEILNGMEDGDIPEDIIKMIEDYINSLYYDGKR